MQKPDSSFAAPVRNVLALALLAAGVTASTLPLRPAAVPQPLLSQSAKPLAIAAVPAARHVVAAGPAAEEPADTEEGDEAGEEEPVLQQLPLAPAEAEPAIIAVAEKEPLPDLQQLRSRLKWVQVQVGGREMVTPDAQSRLLLARSAAARAGLADVGLDFRDVYGVINAETSWVPRSGMGRNGVTSQGLAQFEPGTAKAVGLRNPNDAVEAVHAAARLLKEAAVWSAQRVARLDLAPDARAQKLREGISIYYNLSSHARSAWSGLNTQQLPVETLRHIRNVFMGARQAESLLAGGALPMPSIPAPAPLVLARVATETLTHAAASPHRRATQVAKAAPPKVVGTIAWAKSDAQGGGHREYVAYSDGRVGKQAPRHGGNYITWTPRAG
ncbi:lytic transglycosylase domain-containing protein [Ramlibacter sp. G-1-2-2]|uniref:Lytic transglycosylase domain-containing protein n=1 Tax=Ramlibacter agri TaxID=2728837 RepID=A0A848HHR5_9BURK|nr:hypothetical protein [Ramlibacter agri]NML48053.1 lytic transglycosylase domain-containing protein [Ramlibacter agri]